jgi:ribosomal-protein-alanine N-acetyltransferase
VTVDLDTLLLEPMAACHLEAVVEIEELVFSHPWTRRDFEFALKRENAYCRVVTVNEAFVGYVVGFFINKEFHLADFSIHPKLQRLGLGRQTLENLCTDLYSLAQVISLEVRMSNVAALELYKQFGFQTMAIRKDYYARPQEDALVMLKPLQGKLSDWVTEALASRS